MTASIFASLDTAYLDLPEREKPTEFKMSYKNALKPVMALPTIRFCIWYVPS
jgi:hypothetical protein